MTPDDPYSPEAYRQSMAQAKALRDQAAAGGLRFEAYLPPDLASWLLAKVEAGVFTDPGEAVFVMLGELRDLEPHADLRQESLSRSIQAAADDPRPGVPLEQVKAMFEAMAAAPRPAPAVWPRRIPE